MSDMFSEGKTIASFKYNWTALYNACVFKKSKETIVSLLKAAPDSVKKRDNDGRLPLHIYCKNFDLFWKAEQRQKWDRTKAAEQRKERKRNTEEEKEKAEQRKREEGEDQEEQVEKDGNQEMGEEEEEVKREGEIHEKSERGVEGGGKGKRDVGGQGEDEGGGGEGEEGEEEREDEREGGKDAMNRGGDKEEDEVLEILLLLLKASPETVREKDGDDKCPFDYLTVAHPRSVYEAVVGGLLRAGGETKDGEAEASGEPSSLRLSLGDSDDLFEAMLAAFRLKNVKELEAVVERFVTHSEGCLDLFAWQQFLELRHWGDPDPGQFMEDLKLLFEATWSVLVHKNARTDEASKSATEALTKIVEAYVTKNMAARKNLLPEFLTDHKLKLQKLAATRIFRAYLDSHMRSGLMYIYFFEVFLYFVFTVLFTILSIQFKFVDEVASVWDDLVQRDMAIACFTLALYFLLREIAQFHAMYQLGLQSNWFYDAWNYIDLVASGGTVVLFEYFFRVGPGAEYDHFASVVAMFVWMKVLGFAKAFSQPIATFVLMMSTIFADLRSFMAVLGIIVVMFGHAFYLVLATSASNEDLADLDFGSEAGTAWSLYLMILGTFEPSAFAGFWAEALFLMYSFLVVIILLNVLIAIVGDSYDAVLVKSTELFWQSRLELVAEITTTFDLVLNANLNLKRWKESLVEFSEKWASRFAVMYGVEEDHDWSNGKNKVALGLRILFSPVLLGLAIAFFFLWLLPFMLFASILEQLIEKSFSEVKINIVQALSFVYGFDNTETSNRSNKLLLIIRIIFSPLLFAFTALFFLIWFLPYSVFATLLGKNSFDLQLDLELDSSSDWSGRVLDIVRRVNSSTSSEINKTNLDIQKLNENLNEKVAKIEKDNKTLKNDNKSLKKDNSQIISMLERVMTEMKLEIPVQPKEEDDDKDSDCDSDSYKEEDSAKAKAKTKAKTKSKQIPHRNSGRHPAFEGKEEGEGCLNVSKEDKPKKDNDGKQGDLEEEDATNPMHSEQKGIELQPEKNASNRL
ncbi:hypothetical protein TrLO_g6201 [Triparma laevis f. longispina]|uniref:Ion transport domain-containing protein n=1 Tax=Triparma laevis f. longispina TaxID=1714387 RepID=A0A9W7FU18_9STRA|nr:hypothetical protein TrLO_g6201 [Triparma laevis f. longispina]